MCCTNKHHAPCTMPQCFLQQLTISLSIATHMPQLWDSHINIFLTASKLKCLYMTPTRKDPNFFLVTACCSLCPNSSTITNTNRHNQVNSLHQRSLIPSKSYNNVLLDRDFNGQKHNLQTQSTCLHHERDHAHTNSNHVKLLQWITMLKTSHK